METAQDLQTENQRERLNNLYRLQRHFYDLTRRFFLFGRDTLLRQIEIYGNDRVLEIGCGTGRNLLKLSHLYPQARLYGLDASREMLKTASAKMDANDLVKRVILREGLAEQLDARKTFGLDEPFDAIFFSYTLSMIPAWQAAINAALANLKPESSLYIVDFGDGRDLPRWFYRLLTAWLDVFNVKPRPEIIDYLESLSRNEQGLLRVFPVGKHYAFIAEFRRF